MEPQQNNGLPAVKDIQRKIAAYLEPKDLVALASTSKQMRAVLTQQVLTAKQINEGLVAAKKLLPALKKKAAGLEKLMADPALSPIVRTDKKQTKVDGMRAVNDNILAVFKALKERKKDMSLEQLAEYKTLKATMNELKALLEDLAPTL